MSCLATKQVETCNCSEPRFPTNSSACLSVEQRKCFIRFRWLIFVLKLTNNSSNWNKWNHDGMSFRYLISTSIDFVIWSLQLHAKTFISNIRNSVWPTFPNTWKLFKNTPLRVVFSALFGVGKCGLTRRFCMLIIVRFPILAMNFFHWEGGGIPSEKVKLQS